MKQIALVPLGGVGRPLVDGLVGALEEIFRARVSVEAWSLDLEQFFDEQRLQYNSTAIIRYFLERRGGEERLTGNDSGKTLALVPHDLFVPVLTYVFGEAQLGGPIAVVSHFRLENERYGLPTNRELLRKRFQKEAVHELGHTYGLTHCHLQTCVMHSSRYVEDIDQKGEHFCASCRSELGVGS